MSRLDTLTSWHADWSGLRVAVLGLGVTGFAVADTLTELRAEVLVVASRGSKEHLDLLPVIGARFLQHADDAAVPEELLVFGPDVVVVSPGYHPDHPLLEWAAESGIPVWGDIELAWRLRDKVVRPDGRPADWILITGTNGKTTTTQLTAHMLVEGGLRAAPAGNIGIPVLDAIRDPGGFDVLVVELSSYQLHWSHRNPGGDMYPLAAACLNIADDHIDWHGSLDAYIAAKGRVFERTIEAAVYNIDDPRTMRLVEEADVEEGCRAIGFGLGAPGRSDFGLVEDVLVDRAFLDERHTHALEIATLADLREAGMTAPHSIQNVLAAAALARAAGVEPAAVRDAIRSFRMDAHRTEVVAVAEGITWIDDSKATNAHAADASLRASKSVVWIAGGLLKGVDPAPLVERHAPRLRAAVVIGADRAELLDAFRRHAPGVPVLEVDGAETGGVMPAAVRAAASVAREGDTVLLAPAAASMDQFTDYADRGRRFAEAVRVHLGGGAGDSDQAAADPEPGSDAAR